MKRVVLFLALLISFALSQSPASAQRTYQVGQPVSLDINNGASMDLTVNSVATASEVEGKDASGVFVVLRFLTLNDGSVATTFPITALRVQDDQDREFEFDFTVSDDVTRSEFGHPLDADNLRVNPGLSVEFALVFDVPAGATGLQLSTESVDKFYVDLDSDATVSVSSAPLIAVGEYAETSVFRFRIASAYMLPAANYLSAGTLVVTFEITNISNTDQNFGLPDNPITATMDNGGVFDQNIFVTADVVVAAGEWIGNIGAGQTLNQSSAFVIGMPSSGVPPIPLYVSYWDGGELGTEYRLSLPAV